MEISRSLLVLSALCVQVDTFSLVPRAHINGIHSSALTQARPTNFLLPKPVSVRHLPPSMGLFGLGWGEIGVLAVVGLLVFGPEKLAPMAKNLGLRITAPPP